MQRLVVEDPHPQQRPHAAADGGEQEERPLRHPPDGLPLLLPLGLPLVETKDQKGHKVDDQQPAEQNPPGGAEKARDRRDPAALRGQQHRHENRLFS